MAPFANLFRMEIEPTLPMLFRGPRPSDPGAVQEGLVCHGPFVYAPARTKLCSEPTEISLPILKEMVHRRLADSLSQADGFFYVSRSFLSATIAQDILYKGEAYSILRSFHLQVMFKDNGLYLAVLAGYRVHNRRRLSDVVELFGGTGIRFPQQGICFAGAAGQERWRDCRILELSEGDTCLVSVPSVTLTPVRLRRSRVIPALDKAGINRLLQLGQLKSDVEQQLKQLRTGSGKNEGQSSFEASTKLLREHLGALFPLRLGASKVTIKQEPTTLEGIHAHILRGKYLIVVTDSARSQRAESIREGLKVACFERGDPHPVAIFCTSTTRRRVEELLETLNHPRDQVGGFSGMEKNFGIRLEPLIEGPYVAQNIEDYIGLTQQFILSPDQAKQRALAFYYLSEDEETYQHPVPLYYRVKALLARAGHPSQVVDRDTLTNRYALWNLATNIAAKLGKIPWTLADNSSLEPVQLFLGFSYSSIRTENLGQSRNIAYANVFDRAGTWRFLHADASVFNFDSRLKVFPRLAHEAVIAATDQPGDLRLIEVHYSKRFGRLERKAISEGIRLAAPKASIIFVSVSVDHPVRLFSPGREQMACERGTSVVLGPDCAYLETIEGNKWSGFPRPLRLQVYRDFCLIPQECEDICRRILALTRLNWGSIQEYASLPVTILYSSLVARFTNYFSLNDWREIDHHLKRTPWFL